MPQVSWIDLLRYKFDNTLTRGPMALVGWLAAVSAAFVLLLAGLATALGANPDFDFPQTLWTVLLQALAPNPVDVSAGPPLFLAFMFLVTLGGIFLVSLFIGVLTNDLDGRVQELRKGRSRVIESGHTLILGWSQQIFTVVSELIEAHEGSAAYCIVVLADRDKVQMEDDLRQKLRNRGRARIVCRSGDPIDMDSLSLVSVNMARSVIVLAPDAEDPDANVIKTVLAITNSPQRRRERFRIVAEIRDPRNLAVASLVGKDETEFILAGDLIARIIAQTCRQAGLSAVYNELLNFEGDEMYMHAEPSLVGSTFAEALSAYDDCSVIGLSTEAGVLLNPPGDTVIGATDSIVLIARDGQSISLRKARPATTIPSAIVTAAPPSILPERALILGWNWRGAIIVSHLNSYMAHGSEVTVVARSESVQRELESCCGSLSNTAVHFVQGDTTDRRTLDSLSIPSCDHVILLCYSDEMNRDEADAHTLITLLHLRDIADRSGHRFSTVSEMLDERNRALAEVTRADDFVVSDNVISLMLAQVSENPRLNAVFQELFDPEGNEIYLRPAGDYVAAGQLTDFYTVLESARTRGEVAIGYRLVGRPDVLDSRHGVTVNPRKSDPITFSPDDKIIVLARD